MIKVAGPGSATLTLRSLLYDRGFTAWFDPTLASMLFGLAYVVFWIAVMAILYRWKLFIRV